MGAADPRFESPVDRAIREAVERGDFDDLPGKGQPLPGAGRTGPVEENWWVRGYLEREGLSGEALLPPSVQLRKELDRIDDTVARFTDERRVREHVAEIDARVVDHMRYPVGPRVPIHRPDADAVVARWRATRVRRGRPAPVPHDSAGSAAEPVRDRWWHRLRRR
ncbi:MULTISPECIES: DnaJ family domain-containing protein [Pseudonocardia]|uniref:DnaJ homologue subfamily C member 28 conserved domain-containing protein n=2 Tax=Pseudonocardia TaxID=1847 RepID=A0A1Y2MYJ9_PSEAH|nr:MULTISPECIES: DUF1992 domain-containing protein [Pseudonocardia]OSY39897.1 hypothetical protein BG845_03132 [Pseudonocardia autotrophica]TDN74493.1 uncharacterized protein DUF1992 [Pseudonocardia autotrophica]BBG05260.1 hypothetical protein Pdca_64690 [Pseudonocardia autotrophica]GEC25732.1 hypothetical protein PSA01_27610 [Pseudonocardia saturnea]